MPRRVPAVSDYLPPEWCDDDDVARVDRPRCAVMEPMRTTNFEFVVSEPVGDFTECVDCGFDAVATFPIALINSHGVTPFGCVRRCVRCWLENEDEDDTE